MGLRPRSSRESSGLSRRSFFGMAAAGAALPLVRPSSVLATPGANVVAPGLLRDYTGRLCYNENPLGPAPAAVTAMIDDVDMAHRYTDWFAESLRDDLADMFGLARNNIIAGTGASEILRLCAYAFSGPDGNVVCPYPSYGQFSSDAEFMGSTAIISDLDANHRVDLADVASKIDEFTTAVCITNPNNPTATVLPIADIEAFMAAVPPTVTVIVDEAYHDFVQDPNYDSAISLLATYKNLVIIRTFSKVYGLAGMRIGYAVADPSQIGPMQAWHQWGTVNRLGLAAAKAALTDTDHVTATVDLINQGKQYCYAEFDSMSLEYIPSETSFFMVWVGNAEQVASALNDAGYKVRTGWGMPEWLRVSCGTMDEMYGFIAALRNIMFPQGGIQPANPLRTSLHGNFPNPARGGTRIGFDLAHTAEVELEIFDLHGRLIRTLVKGRRPVGHYNQVWNGLDNQGYPAPAGSYLYRLIAGEHEQIRRMILLPQ